MVESTAGKACGIEEDWQYSRVHILAGDLSPALVFFLTIARYHLNGTEGG
jgi:hypothetical protein